MKCNWKRLNSLMLSTFLQRFSDAEPNVWITQCDFVNKMKVTKSMNLSGCVNLNKIGLVIFVAIDYWNGFKIRFSILITFPIYEQNVITISFICLMIWFNEISSASLVIVLVFYFKMSVTSMVFINLINRLITCLFAYLT